MTQTRREEQRKEMNESLRAGRSEDQIPVGGENFRPTRRQTGPGTNTASYKLVPGLSRGYSVDHPPHLVPRLKKEYSYTSIPQWVFMACSRPVFLTTFVRPRPGKSFFQKTRGPGPNKFIRKYLSIFLS